MKHPFLTNDPSSVSSTTTATIYAPPALRHRFRTTTSPIPTMSTAATIIPTFAAVTLLLGGFNEISAKLTLVGILGIIVHAAITPADLLGPYPNFDNYHPTQPPLRDYALVFGLASIVLVILFSRIYPLVSDTVLSCLARVLISVRLSQLRPLARATRKALQACLRSCGLLVRQPNIPPGQSAPKVQVCLFPLFLTDVAFVDPPIGYHSRPQFPSNPPYSSITPLTILPLLFACPH